MYNTFLFWPLTSRSKEQGKFLFFDCTDTKDYENSQWRFLPLESAGYLIDKKKLCVVIDSSLVNYKIVDLPSRAHERALKSSANNLIEDHLLEDLGDITFSVNKIGTLKYYIRWVSQTITEDIIKNINKHNPARIDLIPHIDFIPTELRNNTLFTLSNYTLNFYDEFTYDYFKTNLNYNTAATQTTKVSRPSITSSDLNDTNLKTEVFRPPQSELDLSIYLTSDIFVIKQSFEHLEKLSVNLISTFGFSKITQKRLFVFIISFIFILILPLATLFFSSKKLETEIGKIQKSNIALYRKQYPEDKKIVNLRSQLAGKLRFAKDSNSKYYIFSLLTQLSQLNSGNQAKEFKINRFTYSQPKNSINLYFTAENVDAVDSLRVYLERMYNVQITSIETTDKGTLGNLIIKEKE